MELIAKQYVAVNNAIAGFSSKIPDRARTAMINVSVYVLLCIGLLRYCNKVMKNFVHFSDLVYPVGIAMILIFTVAGIRCKTSIEKIRIGKAFWFGWMLCFVMMFIMALIHPVVKDYFIWSVMGIFIFPLIFIGHSGRNDFKRLCRTVSEAVLVITYVFIILSLILAPFFSRGELGEIMPEYIGLAVNPNNNGMLVIAFYGPVFYLLMNDRRRAPVYYLMPMGVCIAISVISGCRTAEIGIMLQTLSGLIYYYFASVRPGARRIDWLKMLAAAVIIAAVSLASGFILSRLDNMNLEVYAEDSYEVSLSGGEEIFNELDRLSTGRLGITRYYIEHSSFWGNGSPDGPIMEGYEQSKWSFNNAVDILYISGVIPFIGCVIWTLAVILFIIKCLFGRVERRPEYLFTIVTFAGYFAEFMLEVTIYPLTTSLVLLAYLGFIPVACREKESGSIPN